VFELVEVPEVGHTPRRTARVKGVSSVRRWLYTPRDAYRKQTETPMDRRRRLRGLAGVATGGWLAGCASDSQEPDGETPPDGEPTTEPPDTGTPTIPPDTITSITATVETRDRIRPPGVWDSGEHDLGAYTSRVRVAVEAEEPIEEVFVATPEADVTTDRPGTSTVEATYDVPIDVLTVGETTVRATAVPARGPAKAASVTITKERPRPYRLDLERGERADYLAQLDQAIEKKEAGDYYPPHKSDVIAKTVPDSRQAYLDRNAAAYTGFDTYSSPLSHDDWTVDPDAMEWWHDNDFPNLIELYEKNSSERGEAMIEFIETMDTPFEEAEGMVRQAMTNVEGQYYPNRDESEHEGGHYDFQEFKNEETAREALDWLHPYMFSIDSAIDGRSISTEDEKFAASIQEALDRYTDIETHAWSFDLPEGVRSTHGNGLIWDETNDELLVMETVASPITELGELHPKIENSLYLPTDLRSELGGETKEDTRPPVAYEEYWHPLRFGWSGDTEPMTFKDRKDYSSRTLIAISTGSIDLDRDKSQWWTDAGVGLSTGYVEDRIEKLRNYNDDDNDFNFEQLETESKIMNDFWENYDDNVVLYLDDSDSFQVAGGVEDDLLDEIWKDEAGEYDDFDAYLEENSQEPITAGASGATPTGTSGG
jgi:hypothetical protein